MKKFDSLDKALNWVEKDVIKTAKEKSIPIVAEQVYKDSNDFTYRDTGAMYQTGESNSQFEKGLVIERSPYVRRRYYEGGKAGPGNRQAQPRWFEKTINKYKKPTGI